MVGSVDDSSNWSVTASPGPGPMGTALSGKTCTVSSLTPDNGYVTITATKAGMTLTKIFSVSKSKQGKQGDTTQAAPLAANATATLSTGAVIGHIVTSAPTGPITLTLPSGASMSVELNNASAGDAVNWSLINLSAFVVTLAPGAGGSHPIVGSVTVAAGASVSLRSVKSVTANTYTTYRMG